MENQEQQTMNQQEQVKDPVITIGEKDYKYSELADEQKLMVNHVADLTNKVNSAQFNLEQLQFAKAAFEAQLTKSIETPVEEVETEEV